MMTDLIGGRIQFAFDGIATTLGYIRSNTVRLLGVSTAKRSPVLPDGPTISETAVPGFEASVWFAPVCAGRHAAGRGRTAEQQGQRRARAGRGEGKLPARSATSRSAADRTCSPPRCRRSCKSGRRSCAKRTSASSNRAGDARSCLIANVRCISASSCSAPATIRPAGATKAPTIEQLQPAGDADHRADRRARQVRPVLHLRRVGDGPRRPSVVRQPVRAAHAARGAQHGDDPCRPRRHGVDELRRAVPRRPRLRLARSSQRRPRRLERRHQHPRQGRAQFQQGRSSPSTTCATRSPSEFVDVVRGLWDSWDDGAIVADKATGVYLDKSKVRPLDHKGRFYSVKGPLNIERSPQGHPVIIQAGGSPPGQELSARSADLVFSVVNGDKALGQGRLRQPEAARRQARPRAATSCRSCRA